VPIELDHLVYAVPDLEEGVAGLEGRLGIRAAAGGAHPGMGTRNALIALGPDSYLEILAPDPEQASPGRPLWLGLEGLAHPRVTAWAVRTPDLEALIRRAEIAGVRLGPVIEGSRRRSDGRRLSWRLTDPRVREADGLVPFFIDWGTSPHPAASAPAGASLVALRAEHPHPGDAATLLGNLELDMPVTKGPKAALIAVFETPRGLIELR
jgi:Glyoxalase-like domain